MCALEQVILNPEGNDGDYFWATGIVFENKRRENQDKKRHLKSICHLEAAQSLNSLEKEQIRKGFPTNQQQNECTENAMTAAMFMANS